MTKKGRYELLKLDAYIGVYDRKAKKRLDNLFPTKRLTVKRPASAFEKGYAVMESTDLHEKLAKRRTLSKKEYERLKKKYQR